MLLQTIFCISFIAFSCFGNEFKRIQLYTDVWDNFNYQNAPYKITNHFECGAFCSLQIKCHIFRINEQNNCRYGKLTLKSAGYDQNIDQNLITNDVFVDWGETIKD